MLNKYYKCIVCEKNPQERGLFCLKCFNKDIFIKLKHSKNSIYFRSGRSYKNTTIHGRLLTKEERERL